MGLSVFFAWGAGTSSFSLASPLPPCDFVFFSSHIHCEFRHEH
jgi:hypothetical protein